MFQSMNFDANQRPAPTLTSITPNVIDPLMAHLPANVDSYRDQAVPLALAPLHRIAEEHQCAVVVVAHLNKSTSSPLTLRGRVRLSLVRAAFGL
jgi:hypothetical protein